MMPDFFVHGPEFSGTPKELRAKYFPNAAEALSALEKSQSEEAQVAFSDSINLPYPRPNM
jgi:hypothetical protein